MFRFLVFVLGMLSTQRLSQRDAAWYEAGQPHDPQRADPTMVLQRPGPRGYAPPETEPPGTVPPGTAPPRTAPPGTAPPTQAEPSGRGELPPASWPSGPSGRPGPGRLGPGPGPRRRRIPRWLKGTAVVVVLGLIFRRIIAWAVLTSLSAALHLLGINVHLPSIKLAWPWQTITAGTSTNTDLGPYVLQKIEGISKPALGTETFDFYFTHKVSKSIGFLPCWYSSTFYAVGHAWATVDLNPGPAWWAPATGHYRLQVVSRPGAGQPGHVSVTMVLPPPQLPQSVHDVTIDDTLSKPIDTQHSWTYPGFGCGVVLKPQFAPSVLYSLAQGIAFNRATHAPQVTQPLIRAAESEATQMVRDNFIQPTVNSLGYNLDSFTLRWAAAP